MNFANTTGGLNINLDSFDEIDFIKILFSENPAILIQVNDSDKVVSELGRSGIHAHIIGKPILKRELNIKHKGAQLNFDIDELRDTWFKTSYLLDKNQSTEKYATERFN